MPREVISKKKPQNGPMRTNLRIDSRESPDSRKSFQGSRTEPLFCESRYGGLKIANRRFEAIRVNRAHVTAHYENKGCLCESIRANRPDSRCESPGHLSSGLVDPDRVSPSKPTNMVSQVTKIVP